MIRLVHADSLRWLTSLPSEIADAIITDPPYSSGGTSASARQRPPKRKYLSDTQRTYDSFLGDGRDQRSWIRWMSEWLSEAWRVSKRGAVAALFSDWRQLPATTDALQIAGWIWRGVMVWNKTESVRPCPGRPRPQAEFIVFGSKEALSTTRRCHTPTGILPGVFTHRVIPSEKQHMTAKPLALMLDVARICEPNGLILDPFCGSGTTLVAAHQLGYQAWGCELAPAYIDVTLRRLEEHDIEVQHTPRPR